MKYGRRNYNIGKGWNGDSGNYNFDTADTPLLATYKTNFNNLRGNSLLKIAYTITIFRRRIREFYFFLGTSVFFINHIYHIKILI